MIQLKRILVPSDFSEYSSNAVLYGCELAAKFDAELHLLHAVELVPITYTEGAYFSPESQAEITRDAANRLSELPDAAWCEKLNVTRATVEGHPFVQIIRYAKENDIDLIVIGSHGRGAIAHMLLGSVAEKVVRKAPCPVLTVHNPEHEFVMP